MFATLHGPRPLIEDDADAPIGYALTDAALALLDSLDAEPQPAA